MIALASNSRGTTAMRVRDQLEGLWHDEDFEAWYPRDAGPHMETLRQIVVQPFLVDAREPQPLRRHQGK